MIFFKEQIILILNSKMERIYITVSSAYEYKLN